MEFTQQAISTWKIEFSFICTGNVSLGYPW
uniref:Uncharacterized protein n=1 Tax=Arundo donax TaxID=35708 RepID=A0A0A9AHX4_ARUDO